MLNDLETKVVEKIDEGYTRWAIAEKLGVGETRVRAVIKELCARLECSTYEIPDELKKRGEWDG